MSQVTQNNSNDLKVLKMIQKYSKLLKITQNESKWLKMTQNGSKYKYLEDFVI